MPSASMPSDNKKQADHNSDIYEYTERTTRLVYQIVFAAIAAAVVGIAAILIQILY